MRKRLLSQFVAAAFFWITALANSADADIFSDAWGILTDPFKLGQGSENAVVAAREARDAIIAVQGLQDEIDQDIRVYLTDIDRKIATINENAVALVNEISDEIIEIEQQVVADVILIIRKAECSVTRTVDETISQSFRDTLPSFLLGDRRVVRLPYGTQKTYWLGVFPRGEEPRTIEIDLESGPDPFQVFREIEKAYLDNLQLSTEEDPAVLIYAAWANLARLAKLTSCHYEGEQFEATLVRKFAKYNALVYPWNNSVKVKE